MDFDTAGEAAVLIIKCADFAHAFAGGVDSTLRQFSRAAWYPG
jgi:hypothetical protein